MPVPAPEHPREPIVVDGSNVAHRAGLRDGGFGALVRLADDLDVAGWAVLVVVDASLRHRLTPAEREELEALLEAVDGWVQVPKGHRADDVLLEEAARLDAWVVSDDRFRDHPRPPARRLDPLRVMGAL